MRVRIKARHEVARDVIAFELVDPEGRPLPEFSAGAHIDIKLGDNLTRQYSLCNSPNEQHRYLIGVLREPASRGGSTAMHALPEGALIEISEPRNHFALARDTTHSVLLAGGIGVTPILCMAEQLAHASASFELHYCTREPGRAAFRERLDAPHLQRQSHLYFDNAPAEERIDLAKVLAAPAEGKHVYVCGPGGFIEAVLKHTREFGWESQNVHREYFAAAQPDATANSDSPFQVKLASSGRIIDVAAGESVVKALDKEGITLATSCEEGVCGTCLTRILSGEPDHRDVFLTDEERRANDQFLPCCSRSRSSMLVLDI
jgi:vanillate O-demethylase ferredoxin subunit